VRAAVARTGGSLTLVQVNVDAQSNASTALLAVLRLLAVEDCIVPTDAMGCQTANAQAVCDQGADSVLALRGNQPALEEAVAAGVAAAQASGFQGLAHGQHTTVPEHSPSMTSWMGCYREAVVWSYSAAKSAASRYRSWPTST
jgi:predicted transposase YbfD/YdcC